MFVSVHAAPTRIQTSEEGNTYVSGSDLVVLNPVAGDLFAAGGRVSVEREIGADATVAGGSVTIRAPVGEDLRTAGGSVSIENTVGGELVATGGSVSVRESAHIDGSAWIAGREVRIVGKMGNGARIYGENISLSGETLGDVRLSGRQITLMPGAIIRGNLAYSSPNELSRDPSAQVLGTITREATPEGWEASGSSRMTVSVGPSWFHPFVAVAMLVAGLLLYLLFPSAARGPQRAIRAHPGRSLLLGLALLFTIPPAAILFMVTVIGIPIGLALLLLYPVCLMLGYLATAFLIGGRLAAAFRWPEPQGLGWQALFLALGLIVLSLLGAIPFIGGLVMIVAVVIGLGGWAVWGQAAYGARERRG